ncbi:MAG: hypothetical protein KDJ87_12670 [Rhizobiaceae bacterium]|nr:hypothetical protein [Rhizobiaceae bacterium]
MFPMIKTSLVALSILAGASAGHAADNNHNNSGSHFGRDDRMGGRLDSPEPMERQDLDRNNTGSIDRCDTGAYDEFGNCIVSPDMRP